MSERRPRVVIAGATGRIGSGLVQALAGQADVIALSSRADAGSADQVQWLRCDGFSIPQTEISLAGAQVAVFASKARPTGRLTQADLTDLDILLADTLARAAPLTSVKRLVMYACGERDARELVLRRSGLALSVLRGGDTAAAVKALAALTLAPEAREIQLPAAPLETVEREVKPAVDVLSVQRFTRPAGWSAADVGFAYFSWLGDNVPLVKVARFENSLTVNLGGVGVLKLVQNLGRSTADSCWFDVLDGALVNRTRVGRFEFRTLLDGDVMAALVGYSPRLPWVLYRMTQAIAHRLVMRRFGRWLGEQTGRPAA